MGAGISELGDCYAAAGGLPLGITQDSPLNSRS